MTGAEGQEPVTKPCDECGSIYFAAASSMSQLCPECAHHLYGYRNCSHSFVNERCSLCGWDGSRSSYIKRLTLLSTTADFSGDFPETAGRPPNPPLQSDG